MDKLRLIKDIIIYIFAGIIWLIVRPISIILQLFNYILAVILVKRWKFVFLLYAVVLIFGPDIKWHNILFHDGIIDIPRWCEFLKYNIEKNEVISFTGFIAYGLFAYLLATFIKYLNGALILPETVRLKDFLLRISKYYARRRLVTVERDIRAVRDEGMYNIEAFKKKYMNS